MQVAPPGRGGARMDLNLYRVLDAIYAEGSLTKAGRRLGLSQPATSHALARLRDVFGDPLFLRSAHGMVPTALAKDLIGPARQALRLLEDPLSAAQPFEPAGATLRFRISMSDLNEARLLPRLVQLLRDEAPGVTLESFSVPRRDLVQALATGALDLALDVPLLSDPLVHHAPLGEDRYVCVLRQGHPLGAQALTLERFLELDHIHLSSRPRGLGHVDLALERLGKRRRIMLRAQHFLVAPEVLMTSDLALTVPESFADHMALRYPLRREPLPFPLPPLESHLYWLSQRDADPPLLWFRTLLAQVARGLGKSRKLVPSTGD